MLVGGSLNERRREKEMCSWDWMHSWSSLYQTSWQFLEPKDPNLDSELELKLGKKMVTTTAKSLSLRDLLTMANIQPNTPLWNLKGNLKGKWDILGNLGFLAGSWWETCETSYHNHLFNMYMMFWFKHYWEHFVKFIFLDRSQ